MLPRLQRKPSSNGETRRLDLTAQQWVVAFLIGTATVLAAIFGWRAAAIGSTAAFNDRQSISETIRVEQQRIDVGLGVNGDNRVYSRYLADYAVAAELDNQAAALAAAGQTAAATENRSEARRLRATATELAADAGERSGASRSRMTCDNRPRHHGRSISRSARRRGPPSSRPASARPARSIQPVGPVRRRASAIASRGSPPGPCSCWRPC